MGSVLQQAALGLLIPGCVFVSQGHTDILVGVKAELGTPKLEKPDEGYLEFFVDWLVYCKGRK